MNTKLIFTAFAFAMFTFASVAQTALKLGYTNVDNILSQMPELKQIESDLKTYKSQLDNQFQAKSKEFEEKYKAFEAGQNMMAEPIRVEKQKELMDLQERIQEFQRNAEADLQRKQGSLLEPVLTKIQKAIKEVSTEHAFTYVFNTTAGMGADILLHGPEKDDITPLVLKKLNITPQVQNAQPVNGAKPLGNK
jgi:outer membrane protein